MRRLLPRPCSPRRGVTLIEMLVTVALLVLMMTIIVQIFQAATGTISAAKTYQELDASCRMVDVTIRQDLAGATAKFTPSNGPMSLVNPIPPSSNPNGPANPNGYFEYGENEFADLQSEDTDDYLKFTAQAPEGQPFTGRVWVGPAVVPSAVGPIVPQFQPIVVTSQFAEIIYFLRNGNLYRRVLLIADGRQNTLALTANAAGQVVYFPAMFGGNIAASWQGMNDLSAHPAATGGSVNPIILNDRASLSNRENRYASPRFCNDFLNNLTGAYGPDGLPDDQNIDNIPDLYPTLYPNMVKSGYAAGLMNDWDPTASTTPPYAPPGRAPWSGGATQPDYALMPFPFIFPGMYSRPDPNSVQNGLGWIHSIDPGTAAGGTFLNSLLSLNHSPLDLGDSLAFPPQTDGQTWWGFPTWRETLSPTWNDPYWRVNANAQPFQPIGLSPFIPSSPPASPNAYPLTPVAPVTLGGTFFPGPLVPQPNVDFPVAGGSLQFYGPQWLLAWEDDLILTGVRSFDVKAMDQAYGGYADLGWGDDLRLYGPPYTASVTLPQFNGTALTTPPFLTSNPAPTLVGGVPTVLMQWPPTAGGRIWDLINQTFAHEGRMPPLANDFRFNPLLPAQNIGDSSPSVIRLRRVWDSWSTAYSNPGLRGLNPRTNTAIGAPIGAPVYPAYPAPYPAPLRGIQIQIRVTDPRNQRVKVLTIRQDFTDKL